MDKQQFLDKTPYLYHLTSSDNLDSVLSDRKLYSTVELFEMSSIKSSGDSFLRTRRDNHVALDINGLKVYVRDQQPITRALDRCLTDNWTREDFIHFLNQRVFTWPNLKRLNIHFGRYASEKPVILRLPTLDVIKLNPAPLITNLNSGATRCIPKYRGAPPRGKDTFKSIENYDGNPSSIAEVTFINECVLPDMIEIGIHPNGPWKKA